VTEKRTREEMDSVIYEIKKHLSGRS
jgi:hypothetical protein